MHSGYSHPDTPFSPPYLLKPLFTFLQVPLSQGYFNFVTSVLVLKTIMTHCLKCESGKEKGEVYWTVERKEGEKKLCNYKKIKKKK